jgi:uncharacterized damage-inducible protein DinB
MLPRVVTLLGLTVCFVAVSLYAAAQTPDKPAPTVNPITGGAIQISNFVKGHILKSAAQMPEEDYAFRPTPAVRTFGAMLGHIAETNYRFCAQAAAEPNPSSAEIEKTVTTKSALLERLDLSFAYCDRVLGSLNDRTASEVVSFQHGDAARISVLTINTAHNFEHYGNLITYMRMKGLVPPSSQPTR